MSSAQNQLHDVTPRLSTEPLFASFPRKKNASSSVSVDKRYQQCLPLHGRTSPFSTSTPNISPSQCVPHQRIPLSALSTIKVANHRTREHTTASFQTLSEHAFGPTFLQGGRHSRSCGSVHNHNHMVINSNNEECKASELQNMQFLDDKLNNKKTLLSINSTSQCCSTQTPDADLEGEELTICTKHWSQYTPPVSDFPYNDQKMKPQSLAPAVEPRSDTASMLSIPSSSIRPSEYCDTANARGESFSSGHCAPSAECSRGKHSINSDKNYATNSVRLFGGSTAGLKQLAVPHDKGVENSPYRCFTLASIVSARHKGKEISNACESNVSTGHSNYFVQQYPPPFMRNQSSESTATNTTFSRVMQNDGLRSSTSFADTVDPPRRISFQRVRMIGSGGFGTVYQGILHDGTHVAVKEIKIEPTNLKLIDREVSVMSSLPPHPNCVRYLGSRYSRHHYYIIMEYISGGSIASLRQYIGPFRESVFQHYAYMVLLGLHHLHSHNIIHRDIKGANVLLNENGCAKIVDFGCCKNLNSGKSTLGGGGTPLWMASEVCRGEGATEKSDVWSFGCLCLEMTNETGLPWSFSPGMTLQGLAYALACAQKPPPIPTTLSPISQDFIACCLRLDPKERWSVSQLLNHKFFDQEYYNDDEDDELIVSCNTSAHTSAVKRIVEQVNKGEYVGGLLSEANVGLVVSQSHHSSAHAADNLSNPHSPFFSKGLSTSTRSQPQSSLAAADTSMCGIESHKGCDNSSSKPAYPICNQTGENDQRLRTVNEGFRLDVLDDSEDGDEEIQLDMRRKKSDVYIKEGISPSNESKRYDAAFDDVIALAHHARTEERRAEEAPSTPTLSLTGSSSSSSYLHTMNSLCSDTVGICIPSDTNRTALPVGCVARRRRTRHVKKSNRNNNNKTASSVLRTKDHKAADPKLITHDTDDEPSTNSVSTSIDGAAPTGKHRKESGSKDAIISLVLQDSRNAMSYETREPHVGRGYPLSGTISVKDDTVIHELHQEYAMTTFASIPLGASEEPSFSTENYLSTNSLQRQQTHRQPTPPSFSSTNTSPLSKLVWSTSGSGRIHKDVSGTVRESRPSGCYAKSSVTQLPAPCENHLSNCESVTSPVLQNKKKQKKSTFVWLWNKF